MWKDRNVTLVSILLFIFCKFTCNSLFFSLSLSLCIYKFPRKIVDRIDSNVDGYITTDELKAWIKRVQKRYVYENVAKVWSDYDLNKDNKISWDEYKQATYGYYLGEYFWSETFQCFNIDVKKPPSWDSTSSVLPANPEEFEDATDQFSFKKMLPRDERRFKAADINGDVAAEREEFTAFLHPEEFEHMQEIVVLVSVTWIMGFGF